MDHGYDGLVAFNVIMGLRLFRGARGRHDAAIRGEWEEVLPGGLPCLGQSFRESVLSL